MTGANMTTTYSARAIFHNECIALGISRIAKELSLSPIIEQEGDSIARKYDSISSQEACKIAISMLFKSLCTDGLSPNAIANVTSRVIDRELEEKWHGVTTHMVKQLAHNLDYSTITIDQAEACLAVVDNSTARKAGATRHAISLLILANADKLKCIGSISPEQLINLASLNTEESTKIIFSNLSAEQASKPMYEELTILLAGKMGFAGPIFYEGQDLIDWIFSTNQTKAIEALKSCRPNAKPTQASGIHLVFKELFC